MMKIDPRLIIEFSVIAEEGSFTKAAARLRVAQPWLSTRLRRLETILGFALFERNTRRIALTREGAQLINAARTLSAAAETFDDLARRFRDGQHQVLRVGAPPYTKAISARREMIDRFVAKHPRANFEIQTGWSLGLQDRVRSGELDFAFGIGDCEVEGCEGLVLRELELSITVASDHRLVHVDTLTPDDLRGETVYVYTRSLNPQLWDALYTPLIEAGVRLVERPEVAEGGGSAMGRDDPPVAFVNTQESAPPSSTTVAIPMAGGRPAPLYLLRRSGTMSPLAASFWSSGIAVSE